MKDFSAIQMLEDEFCYIYQCLLKQAELNKVLTIEIGKLKQQIKNMKGENEDVSYQG